MAAFSISWIKKQGLTGSDEQLNKLSDLLQDELEIRVGMILMDNLTEAQVDEFEAIGKDPKAAEDAQIDWLETAYPDYQKVVFAQKTKLSKQLRTSADKLAFIHNLSREDN